MQDRFISVLLVGTGGFFGAVARYLVGVVMPFLVGGFPYATMLVNLVGCIIIGLLSELALTSHMISSELRLLLVAGFCGGFTTFSSYMFEIMAMLRDGAVFTASIYLSGSILGGMLCLYLGILLARAIV
ncbi:MULTISPECIES: fluoride efflux transporter CrcB [Prosthecochloris]|uniref:Fluoride-specific ion channel FluC n=1 Tax=Prosthecochloris vibrioformis TaxID=1098 RepID=A0A5C4RZP1_PROVB|nr:MULTISPECIES: fluoride efflux transporter CrcB [Prosthecochloris]ANT63961.1 camphor resistance protein CrcB [Prosthecochloris sp. CIB 2401]TNJ36462.1 fluoride efflux transporter CrcB [Prosthecochloris vibrioformis]